MTPHLFHRWGKWEQYVREFKRIPFGMTHLPSIVDAAPWDREGRQRRTCAVCGKQQDRKITG